MAKLTGYEAIDYAEANELTLNKYNDPTEDAREGLTPDEARKVASEDPSLIWLEAEIAQFSEGDRVEGGDNEEDHDTGKVIAVEGDQVTVAWSSGVRTTQDASLLRSAE